MTKNLLFYSYLGSAVLVILLSTFNLGNYFRERRVLGIQTEYLSQNDFAKERDFWQNFLSQNPDYLEGWIELSKLESQSGNQRAAHDAINRAREVNPNSPEIKESENNLGI